LRGFWAHTGAAVLVVLALAPLYAGVLTRAEAIVASKRGPSVLQPYRDLAKLRRKAARSVTRFPGCSDVFPQPTRMRPRLVPAELLRRTGKHTGTAAGHADCSVLSPARRAGAYRRDRPPPARLPSDRAGTLRDEPPAEPPQATARHARRLWLLDRAATRMALAGLGVLVLAGAAAPDLTACSPRSASRRRRPPPGGPVMSRRPVPLLGSLRLAHPGRIDRRGRRLPHRPAVLAARQVTGRHQLCSRSPGTGEGGVPSNTLAAVR
jgi:hypothetical protein